MPLVAAAICASAALFPAVVAAEPVAVSAARDDTWQFGAFIYGYFPSISSEAAFPNGGSGDVIVDASDLITNLKMAFLGSFEAREGRWGLFTDVMYLNFGQFKSKFHDMTIGAIGLPADVSSSTNFDVKSVVWSVAGTYRALANPDAVLDVFAGARLLDAKMTLNWTLNGNIGQIPAPGRAGSSDIKENFTDGVIGFKGQIAIGQDLKWFIPYYADIGTGNSDLTWQAIGGLGYAFHWGEVLGGWRYLEYQFKSDSEIESMNLSGPMLGVAFRW